FFLGLMMFAGADLAARGRARAGVGTVGGAGGDAAGGAASVAVPMFAVALLSAMVGAYYAGYHPFHGDLGCSPVEEWMVTGFAMAAFLLLEAGAPFLAALAALLSVLTFPSGLMFAGLVGVAGLLVSGGRRRDVWKFGFGFAAMALAYAVLLVIYTKSNGSFDAMIGEWYEKYFQGRARFAAEPWLRKAKAAGWFALLAGGLPAVGMLGAIVRGDRVARHLGLLGLLWVAFFVMSPNKNVHYFMPAALLPMAATLRWLGAGGGAARDRWVAGVLTGSALAVIALCRPASVPPYVADREFGRKTLFLAGSEREAVDYSQILFQVSKPLWHWEPGDPWTIGHHTWVMYAERGYEPRPEHEFFVGQGPPPVEGLKEITRLAVRGGGTVTFWARDGRASLRTWREKTYPLRQDLSRFSFEMSPYEEKP
ncbi:MAG: hypothetical protein KC591_00060, partial [Gemmatimonadetes bacterium]|nr:hypothetical protein [Gemmatimonadota bacterium]